MKKFYLLLILCAISIASYAQYTLTANDVIFNDGVITGYINHVQKDIIIPDNFDGVSVTGIGRDAFAFKTLNSVVLPESLTEIGLYAFSRNSLSSIVMPETLKYIGAFAFQYNSLTSIDLSKSLIFVGSQAFRENAIASIALPLGEYNWIDRSGNMVTEITNFYDRYRIDRPYLLTKSDVVFEEGIIVKSINLLRKGYYYS